MLVINRKINEDIYVLDENHKLVMVIRLARIKGGQGWIGITADKNKFTIKRDYNQVQKLMEKTEAV